MEGLSLSLFRKAKKKVDQDRATRKASSQDQFSSQVDKNASKSDRKDDRQAVHEKWKRNLNRTSYITTSIAKRARIGTDEEKEDDTLSTMCSNRKQINSTTIQNDRSKKTEDILDSNSKSLSSTEVHRVQVSKAKKNTDTVSQASAATVTDPAPDVGTFAFIKTWKISANAVNRQKALSHSDDYNKSALVKKLPVGRQVVIELHSDEDEESPTRADPSIVPHNQTTLKRKAKELPCVSQGTKSMRDGLGRLQGLSRRDKVPRAFEREEYDMQVEATQYKENNIILKKAVERLKEERRIIQVEAKQYEENSSALEKAAERLNEERRAMQARLRQYKENHTILKKAFERLKEEKCDMEIEAMQCKDTRAILEKKYDMQSHFSGSLRQSDNKSRELFPTETLRSTGVDYTDNHLALKIAPKSSKEVVPPVTLQGPANTTNAIPGEVSRASAYLCGHIEASVSCNIAQVPKTRQTRTCKVTLNGRECPIKSTCPGSQCRKRCVLYNDNSSVTHERGRKQITCIVKMNGQLLPRTKCLLYKPKPRQMNNTKLSNKVVQPVTLQGPANTTNAFPFAHTNTSVSGNITQVPKKRQTRTCKVVLNGRECPIKSSCPGRQCRKRCVLYNCNTNAV